MRDTIPSGIGSLLPSVIASHVRRSITSGADAAHAFPATRVNTGLDTDTGEERIYDWSQDTSENFALRLCIEALIEAGAGNVPSRRSKDAQALARREAILKEIASLWEKVAQGRTSLWEVLEENAQKPNTIFAILHERLEQIRGVDAKNPSELLLRFAKNLRPWTSVPELMKEVRGWLEELRSHGQSGEGAARIMTFQAAKGLEADTVCVVGLNDEVVMRGSAIEGEVEEAARLAYVSMTRAKEELHLFHARKREASMTFLKKSYGLKPSRFVVAADPGKKLTKYHQAPSKKK